jgi:hypothetical protein
MRILHLGSGLIEKLVQVIHRDEIERSDPGWLTLPFAIPRSRIHPSGCVAGGNFDPQAAVPVLAEIPACKLLIKNHLPPASGGLAGPFLW